MTTYNKGWGEGGWGINGFGGIAPAYVVTGVSGTGSVGTVVVAVGELVSVTGVAGTGAVGTIRIIGWTTINDAQTPNWVDIAA